MSFISVAKLEEMKLTSRGNPSKIAEYKRENEKYNKLKELYFNDEIPFVDTPDESYVKQLEQKAVETNDEADKIRYAMMKDRYDYHKYKSQSEQKNNLQMKHELQRKLVEGEKLTKIDLMTAEKLARKNPTAENLVIYSKIKREIEAAD
jgi:hypothetical protein